MSNDSNTAAYVNVFNKSMKNEKDDDTTDCKHPIKQELDIKIENEEIPIEHEVDSFELENDRLMKIFEEVSSGEDTPDPLSDDEEYGSDANYEPGDDDSGDSDSISNDSSTPNARCRIRTLSDKSDSQSSIGSHNDMTIPQMQTTRDNIESQDQVSHEISTSQQPTTSVNEYRSSEDVPYRSVVLENTPPENEEWSNTTTDLPEFNFDSSSEGVRVNIDGNSSVLDVFNYVFPANIVDYIVSCTNSYGKAFCHRDRPITRHSRRYAFKETNRAEVLTFLGLCILQGQVNVPRKRKLFTYSDALYYHPVFNYTMSARRYEQLLRCLCISELNAKGYGKVVKFIDTVTANFRQIYSPGKELSLDESLLLFRGRLCFRQYLKNKKARCGIQFYVLTTADGYVINMIMYAGKINNDTEIEKIVLRLMSPYLLKGHHLFMDNYYNSVNLSQKLLGFKTHTTGTLRSNRKGNPKELVKRKLKKNDHFWIRKKQVYVSKWLDTRPVLMITTRHHPRMIEVANRHGSKRRRPEEVSSYSRFMSRMDRSDQMIAYYSSPRKTLRWYKKVFFHLLDLSIWNSFYLYKKYCKDDSKKYDFVTFREDLIKKLIKPNQDVKCGDLVKNTSRYDNRLKGRATFNPLPCSSSNNLGHWPEKIPTRSDSKKKSYFLKCKLCTRKNIRKETSYRCKGCEDLPALCPGCFEEWHRQN